MKYLRTDGIFSKALSNAMKDRLDPDPFKVAPDPQDNHKILITTPSPYTAFLVSSLQSAFSTILSPEIPDAGLSLKTAIHQVNAPDLTADDSGHVVLGTPDALKRLLGRHDRNYAQKNNTPDPSSGKVAVIAPVLGYVAVPVTSKEEEEDLCKSFVRSAIEDFRQRIAEAQLAPLNFDQALRL